MSPDIRLFILQSFFNFYKLLLYVLLIYVKGSRCIIF